MTGSSAPSLDRLPPGLRRVSAGIAPGVIISLHSSRRRRAVLLSATAVAAVAALAGLVGTQATGTAFGATAPVSDAREVAHFDIATLQQPENITLASNGTAYMTFNRSLQVAKVTTDGKITVLATLPQSPDGNAIASGIVRTGDGTLYVGYNAGTLSGIYRIPADGGTPVEVVALPAADFLNGLALDAENNALYATASTYGTVWKVSLKTGKAVLWAQGAEFQSATVGGKGANGIKVHDGAVWVSNTSSGVLLRVPVKRDGSAGTPTVQATGVTGIDDFAFTGHGDQVLAAQNVLSEASLVNGDGTHETVLTVADGLQNPTSVAVKGSTLYVASGAYFTRTDPNLLLAKLG